MGDGRIGAAIEELELKQRNITSGSVCLFMKAESTQQWVEPESTNAETAGVLYNSKVTEGMRELGQKEQTC